MKYSSTVPAAAVVVVVVVVIKAVETLEGGGGLGNLSLSYLHIFFNKIRNTIEFELVQAN